jgi:hypothetical protein
MIGFAPMAMSGLTVHHPAMALHKRQKRNVTTLF